MAKKKTIKNAPVKSAGNSEHDYTFKTENMGAYRFDKDCYVSLKVNRTSLDVALGAIIDGETYATTANLAGGSAGGGTIIRYLSDGDQSYDLDIIAGTIQAAAGASMSIKYNDGDWEACEIVNNEWTSASGTGTINISDGFVDSLTYSYDSTTKLLDGDFLYFRWEV